MKFAPESLVAPFAAEVSVVDLVNTIINDAYVRGSSDVHIEPQEDRVQVRLRTDGVLEETHSFAKTIQAEVIARIKVLAGLRTDEHAAAQDGRFRFYAPDNAYAVDVRVSLMPTYHGQNAVLRLLTQQAEARSLHDLGFSKSDEAKIIQALEKQSGMILATGPTGSGKTTTLYSLLHMLNNKETSLVTIEDPIEYAMYNIGQMQVNARAGLTFANGLRSILRQDPDTIMVGEIRDAETAGIAVNTALTGHLLLSTLHTSDAATTLPRLLDLGLDAYLVSSTVNIAIGQRLVRTICKNCKTSFKVDAELAKHLKRLTVQHHMEAGETLYKGMGCETCKGSGLRGRIGLYEVLVADAKIREAILRKAPASEIKEIAIINGMQTMLDDGFAKVRAGLTTVEEVVRIGTIE